jgi:HlyD family secretion protein
MNRSIFGSLICLLIAAGCGDGAPDPDAYGTFEATEVLVSAEVPGRLLTFDVREGDRLDAGMLVALIDTTQLALQRRQALAAREAARSQTPGVHAQVDVIQEQVREARQEHDRLLRMLPGGGATEQQVDQAAARVAVLERQITSTRTRSAPIAAEVESADARIAQITDQINRSAVVNPIHGTVLTTYVEAHEMTSAGRPLYKIADVSEMTLRAYLSGRQLADVALGQHVTVRFDGPGGRLEQRTGIVSSIASQAEFTPRHIQTRDERVNLVYAVRVRVDNADGRIRAGMPGELYLSFAPENGDD